MTEEISVGFCKISNLEVEYEGLYNTQIDDVIEMFSKSVFVKIDVCYCQVRGNLETAPVVTDIYRKCCWEGCK